MWFVIVEHARKRGVVYHTCRSGWLNQTVWPLIGIHKNKKTSLLHFSERLKMLYTVFGLLKSYLLYIVLTLKLLYKCDNFFIHLETLVWFYIRQFTYTAVATLTLYNNSSEYGLNGCLLHVPSRFLSFNSTDSDWIQVKEPNDLQLSISYTSFCCPLKIDPPTQSWADFCGWPCGHSFGKRVLEKNLINSLRRTERGRKRWRQRYSGEVEEEMREKRGLVSKDRDGEGKRWSGEKRRNQEERG